ncbi:MAG: hypothetical protein ABDH28_02220 [Brevinematia bacterium]
MRGKTILVLAAILGSVVYLLGCPKMFKVKVRETAMKETATMVVVEDEELSKILVYVGDVPLGEVGRSASGIEIDVGGTVVLSAQGRNPKGKPIPVNPTWILSKPGIVEISPAKGSRVTVRGVRQGSVDIIVEYKGVKTVVESIYVR